MKHWFETFCSILRYTVGKITPVPAREVRSSDFGERARIRMYFPKKGSQLTPPHSSLDFYWKDYCPMVFRYSLSELHVYMILRLEAYSQCDFIYFQEFERDVQIGRRGVHDVYLRRLWSKGYNFSRKKWQHILYFS